jgi:hypothetical protein
MAWSKRKTSKPTPRNRHTTINHALQELKHRWKVPLTSKTYKIIGNISLHGGIELLSIDKCTHWHYYYGLPTSALSRSALGLKLKSCGFCDLSALTQSTLDLNMFSSSMALHHFIIDMNQVLGREFLIPSWTEVSLRIYLPFFILLSCHLVDERGLRQ